MTEEKAVTMDTKQLTEGIAKLVKRYDPADVEIYKWACKRHELHNDFLEDAQLEYDMEKGCLDTNGNNSVDYVTDGVIGYEWYMLDDRDYDYTCLANTNERADYESWYGDKDAKVLVIVLDRP